MKITLGLSMVLHPRVLVNITTFTTYTIQTTTYLGTICTHISFYHYDYTLKLYSTYLEVSDYQLHTSYF